MSKYTQLRALLGLGADADESILQKAMGAAGGRVEAAANIFLDMQSRRAAVQAHKPRVRSASAATTSSAAPPPAAAKAPSKKNTSSTSEVVDVDLQEDGADMAAAVGAASSSTSAAPSKVQLPMAPEPQAKQDDGVLRLRSWHQVEATCTSGGAQCDATTELAVWLEMSTSAATTTNSSAKAASGTEKSTKSGGGFSVAFLGADPLVAQPVLGLVRFGTVPKGGTLAAMPDVLLSGGTTGAAAQPSDKSFSSTAASRPNPLGRISPDWSRALGPLLEAGLVRVRCNIEVAPNPLRFGATLFLRLSVSFTPGATTQALFSHARLPPQLYCEGAAGGGGLRPACVLRAACFELCMLCVHGHSAALPQGRQLTAAAASSSSSSKPAAAAKGASSSAKGASSTPAAVSEKGKKPGGALSSAASTASSAAAAKSFFKSTAATSTAAADVDVDLDAEEEKVSETEKGALYRKVEAAAQLPLAGQPALLRGLVLRPYQLQALSWMLAREEGGVPKGVSWAQELQRRESNRAPSAASAANSAASPSSSAAVEFAAATATAAGCSEEDAIEFVSDGAGDALSPRADGGASSSRGAAVSSSAAGSSAPALPDEALLQSLLRDMLQRGRKGPSSSSSSSTSSSSSGSSLAGSLWERAHRTFENGLPLFLNPFARCAATEPPPPTQCRGGILADEMGLGKTIEMLALIAAQSGADAARVEAWRAGADSVARVKAPPRPGSPSPSKSGSSSSSSAKAHSKEGGAVASPSANGGAAAASDRPDGGLLPLSATLVVCPMSLIGQWARECTTFSFALTSRAPQATAAARSRARSSGAAAAAEAAAPDSDAAPVPSSEQAGSQAATSSAPPFPSAAAPPAAAASSSRAAAAPAVRAGSCRVLVHYGPERTRSARNFSKYDIVITTYGTLASENDAFEAKEAAKLKAAKEGGEGAADAAVAGGKKRKRAARSDSKSASHPLFGAHWTRVVLDEAHSIRNRTTKTAAAACTVSARYRWALTGTPLQNSLQDLFSLLRFLRYEPWGELGWWKRVISDPHEAKDPRAMPALQVVLRPLLLRRTKAMTDCDGKKIGDLEAADVRVVLVDMTPPQRTFYDALYARSKMRFQDMMRSAGGIASHYAAILTLLVRLRQACDHPFLVLGGKGVSVAAPSSSSPAAAQGGGSDDDDDDDNGSIVDVDALGPGDEPLLQPEETDRVAYEALYRCFVGSGSDAAPSSSSSASSVLAPLSQAAPPSPLLPGLPWRSSAKVDVLLADLLAMKAHNARCRRIMRSSAMGFGGLQWYSAAAGSGRAGKGGGGASSAAAAGSARTPSAPACAGEGRSGSGAGRKGKKKKKKYVRAHNAASAATHGSSGDVHQQLARAAEFMPAVRGSRGKRRGTPDDAESDGDVICLDDDGEEPRSQARGDSSDDAATPSSYGSGDDDNDDDDDDSEDEDYVAPGSKSRGWPSSRRRRSPLRAASAARIAAAAAAHASKPQPRRVIEDSDSDEGGLFTKEESGDEGAAAGGGGKAGQRRSAAAAAGVAGGAAGAKGEGHDDGGEVIVLSGDESTATPAPPSDGGSVGAAAVGADSSQQGPAAAASPVATAADDDDEGPLDMTVVEEEPAESDVSEIGGMRLCGLTKVCVFSNFTTMLDVVQQALKEHDIACVRLDGSMSQAQRETAIAAFNADPKVFVFLLSLTAGGMGLNLTAASVCYLLDVWYNPAAESQALGRVHRLGQRKQVYVKRFVARDAVEVEMVAIQEGKRKLASAALEAGEGGSARLTEAEIRQIFAH